nr:hypothetical protein [Clostridioides difficile]
MEDIVAYSLCNCGYKNHWYEKGIVKDINVDRLLYTIGIKDTLIYN